MTVSKTTASSNPDVCSPGLKLLSRFSDCFLKSRSGLRNVKRALDYNKKTLLLTLPLLMLSTGCVAINLDNSKRLINRPDFKTAATAAPEWVSDALKTINRLEYEVERQ